MRPPSQFLFGKPKPFRKLGPSGKAAQLVSIHIYDTHCMNKFRLVQSFLVPIDAGRGRGTRAVRSRIRSEVESYSDRRGRGRPKNECIDIEVVAAVLEGLRLRGFRGGHGAPKQAFFLASFKDLERLGGHAGVERLKRRFLIIIWARQHIEVEHQSSIMRVATATLGTGLMCRRGGRMLLLSNRGAAAQDSEGGHQDTHDHAVAKTDDVHSVPINQRRVDDLRSVPVHPR
jgi:hypothetical protein